MALFSEYKAFNGRYRPSYWGAIPMPIVPPISSSLAFGLFAFIFFHSKEAKEGMWLLGAGAIGLSIISLIIAYKRFKAINREEILKIEYQAVRLKNAKDVAV